MDQHLLDLFNPNGRPKGAALLVTEAQSLPLDSSIILQGPEPTNHPELVTILNAIASPQRHIAIFTNAHTLMTPEACAWMAAIPNLNIIVTPFDQALFLAGSVESFNQAYRRSLEAIAALLSLNLRVAAWIPLLSSNQHHLIDIVQGLHNLRLTNIILAYPLPQGHPTRYSNLHHDVTQAINAVPTTVLIENVPACMLGIEHSHASRLFTMHDRLKSHVPACASCAFHASCPGMFTSYIASHGDSEFCALDQTGEPILTPATPPLSLHQAAVQGVAEAFAPAVQDQGITPSPDEIHAILQAIPIHPEFWDLVEHLGHPLPILVPLLTLLIRQGLVVQHLTHFSLSMPSSPAGMPQDFSTKRLESNPAFCQLRVTQQDLARRTSFITQQCPSSGRLVVLGDDDFMSLTLASTRHFSHVTVLEIDPLIIDQIRMIAAQESLPVEIIRHDLREPLPSRLVGRFDAFYTDSPYTPNGFELFVSRGIHLLKQKPKLHGFASFSPQLPILDHVELPVQRIISKMGLYIEHKAQPAANVIPPGFKAAFPTLNDVANALQQPPPGLSEQDKWYLACLGRKESLFHFLTTATSKPTIIGPCHDEIYYERHPLDYYRSRIDWSRWRQLVSDAAFG